MHVNVKRRLAALAAQRKAGEEYEDGIFICDPDDPDDPEAARLRVYCEKYPNRTVFIMPPGSDCMAYPEVSE